MRCVHPFCMPSATRSGARALMCCWHTSVLGLLPGESERARAIYELAISQSVLDMPEVVWKAYIDFEIAEGNRDNTRHLYERLLERTKHVKVWMSFAKFEASTLRELADPEEGAVEGQDPAAEEDTDEAREARAAAARSIYERAYRCLRDDQPDAKEEAVMLLEAWRGFEREVAGSKSEGSGAGSAVEAVERKMPKRVKRKRPIVTDDGLEAGMEEYFDYIFPDEANNAPNLKASPPCSCFPEAWPRHPLHPWFHGFRMPPWETLRASHL